MARKLKDQKRSGYSCVAKVCPKPADLARFPELMHIVRAEWRARMEYCRSGQAVARRAKARVEWKGRRKHDKKRKAKSG